MYSEVAVQGSFLRKRSSEKFRKISRQISVLKSFFNEVCSPTDFSTGVSENRVIDDSLPKVVLKMQGNVNTET